MRIFLLSLSFVFYTNLAAQDRNVIWQHGLGGDQSFWAETALDFTNQREMEPIAVDANSANGVRSMASDIVNRTRQRAAGPQTIAIGHSMGGVAFREIAARTAPGHFGGVITVGSPMNGAQIANAAIDGRAEAYIEHGANELLKGPLRSLLGKSYVIVRAGVRAFTGQSLQEVLTEGSIDDLNAFANSASVTDLAVGSAYMQSAVRLDVPQHKVSLKGNEERPTHYRLASTTAFSNDQILVNASEEARGVYNVKYITNLAVGAGFLSPLSAWRAAG